MSTVRPSYAYGDIVLVSGLLDPQGRNPKDRPCVIVTNPASAPEARQIVVAISTVLPDRLADDYVLLPYQNPRHPRTGLNRRNAAIGRRIQEVDESQIFRKVGIVPGKEIRALAEVLARLEEAEDEPTGESFTPNRIVNIRIVRVAAPRRASYNHDVPRRRWHRDSPFDEHRRPFDRP